MLKGVITFLSSYWGGVPQGRGERQTNLFDYNYLVQ